MEPDKNIPGTPNSADPTRSRNGEAPADPSNTSHIGQPIEQLVIKKDEGISEQAGQGEDWQERSIPGEGEDSFGETVENLLKNPSPEDMEEKNS